MTRPDIPPDQLARAVRTFRDRFGRAPRYAAAAPGRVNLIGEHTDYNDGFVLPMAIQRQTIIVADRAPGTGSGGAGVSPATRKFSHLIRVITNADPAPIEFPLDPVLGSGGPPWGNYVRGVVTLMLREGFDPGGFDAVIDSTVPLGGGLSSSASLEVAVATLVEALCGRKMELAAKALLCQKAENVFAQAPCGIMDQFIAVFGQADHAMLLDCRSRRPRMVPLDDPGLTVLIANTNVKHDLATGEYGRRRQQCEQAARTLGVKALRDLAPPDLAAAEGRLDPVVYRRARHVVSENARTEQAAREMEGRNWPALGRLMFASHQSLRDDFEVSCAELDILVDLAQELSSGGGGVIGSRMTGGGFGGCTVSLIRTQQVDQITQRLHDGYKDRTGIEPTIFPTRPADGAREIGV